MLASTNARRDFRMISAPFDRFPSFRRFSCRDVRFSPGCVPGSALRARRQPVRAGDKRSRDMMTVITAGSETRQADLRGRHEVEQRDARSRVTRRLRHNSCWPRANSRRDRSELASRSRGSDRLRLTRADAVARKYNSNKAFAITLVGPTRARRSAASRSRSAASTPRSANPESKPRRTGR